MGTAGTAVTEELNSETLQLRHRKLVIRELEFGELVKTEQMATITTDDPETGGKTTRFDERLQQKLMVDKAIVSAEPPLPEGGIDKLGTRAVIALNAIVSRLNYGEVDPTTGLASALYTETKSAPKTEAKAAKS